MSNASKNGKTCFLKNYGIPFDKVRDETLPGDLVIALNHRASVHVLNHWKHGGPNEQRRVEIIQLANNVIKCWCEAPSLFPADAGALSDCKQIERIWKNGERH